MPPPAIAWEGSFPAPFRGVFPHALFGSALLPPVPAQGSLI